MEDIRATACRGSREGLCALRKAAVCGDPTQEQTPSKSCGPRREAHAGTGFSGRTCDPQVTKTGKLQHGPFLLDCTPWKVPMLEKVVGLYPVEGTDDFCFWVYAIILHRC